MPACFSHGRTGERESGMKLLVQSAAVGAGGFCGAIARFLVASLCGWIFPVTFPVGTFVVNITGSLFLGWFMTAIGGRLIVSTNVQLAIATGFVGAFTTFSTFMFESNALMQQGSQIKTTLNLVGSILVGLAAVRLGMYLGSR